MNLAQKLSPRQLGAAIQALFAHDSKQYWIVLVFAVQAGALTLAIPLAVQMFVNSVTFIGTTQPIIILTLVLLGVLSLSAVLQLLQFRTVEKLEQRFFGQNLVRFIESIPHLKNTEEYPRSHLAMRFWELISVQKNIKSLFIEALALLLQMISGLILIAFYHPWLLVFGMMLVFAVYFLIRATRQTSINRRYELSHIKHELANFSHDLSLHSHVFLGNQSKRYLQFKIDHLLGEFLNARRYYFSSVMSQNVGLMLVYVIGSSMLLGIGGLLVLKEQLALGQLVASEIVISSVLYNLWKFGLKIESIDSFFVSSFKFEEIFKHVHHHGDGKESPNLEPFSFKLQNITHPSLPFSEPIQKEFQGRSHILLWGPPGSGKSLICQLISGEVRPAQGYAELCSIDLREIQEASLRDYIVRVRQDEIIYGSILENVRCLRPEATVAEVRKILEDLDAIESISELPEGIDTLVDDQDPRLSRRTRILITIARALISKSPVLIVDELLDGLDPRCLARTLNVLKQSESTKLLLITSSQDSLKAEFNQIWEVQHAD